MAWEQKVQFLPDPAVVRPVAMLVAASNCDDTAQRPWEEDAVGLALSLVGGCTDHYLKYIYAYVYICVCIHICVYIYIYIYIYVYIYIYTYMCIYIYIYIYIYI